MAKVVQVGVVGALQRSHPALTQLWMQWTGVRDLEWATFDMLPSETGRGVATSVSLAARKGVDYTWQGLCDLLAIPEDGSERRSMPVYLAGKHPGHAAFWAALKKRELEEVDGPLEWWWALMVMRYRGVRKASEALIREAIGDDPAFDRGLISFPNPSLKRAGHTAASISKSYRQPEKVVVSFRVKRKSRIEGLAFGLDDDRFKGRFVSRLVDLAVQRS